LAIFQFTTAQTAEARMTAKSTVKIGPKADKVERSNANDPRWNDAFRHLSRLLGHGQRFATSVPLAGAAWSTPPHIPGAFPAATFGGFPLFAAALVLSLAS
jgi:hypothetical protein